MVKYVSGVKIIKFIQNKKILFCSWTENRKNVVFPVSNLKNHFKSKHEGILFATIAGSLKEHVESKHEGIRYPCVNCEYAATFVSSLKKHVESKHEGVRYPC